MKLCPRCCGSGVIINSETFEKIICPDCNGTGSCGGGVMVCGIPKKNMVSPPKTPLARIAELEAENERLRKRIEELEPEPFPPDSEPVAWICPPNNLEKRFEEKEK